MHFESELQMVIPSDIRRGFSDLCDFCRPKKKSHDWCTFLEKLLAAPDDDVVKCMPDIAIGNQKRSNLLHTIPQFRNAPDTNLEGVPVLGAFKRSMRLIVGIYKKHGALNWCGGNFDDTAVPKACAVGNTFIVRLLVDVGASTSLPRLF